VWMGGSPGHCGAHAKGVLRLLYISDSGPWPLAQYRTPTLYCCSGFIWQPHQARPHLGARQERQKASRKPGRRTWHSSILCSSLDSLPDTRATFRLPAATGSCRMRASTSCRGPQKTLALRGNRHTRRTTAAYLGGWCRRFGFFQRHRRQNLALRNQHARDARLRIRAERAAHG
jgi:hypothetical protein